MRYCRQTALKEIGESGQKALGEASVLIVGAGGLGSPSSLYLAGAGVGRIGIVDSDTISISNLQRQVLYDTSMTGMNKAECAAKRLSALNPEINVTAYPFMLDSGNAEEIISGYDIVVDGTDNFRTRNIIDTVCDRLRKPYVFGAIGEFNGMVSTFCCDKGGKYRRLRDLFPDAEEAPEQSRAVLGVTPGIVGCIQANETVKLICGFGENLCGRLLTIDLLTMETNILNI